MAIFHLSTSTVARAKGQSAVSRLAYIARAAITDERTGLTHDQRGAGPLLSLEIVGFPIAPSGSEVAPGDTLSRLANAMEGAERRKNSTIARSSILALPHELPHDRQRALLRGYCLALRDRYGVASVAAIHPPDARGDHRNTHAHIVETTRRVGPDGTLGAKVRELDDRATGPAEIEWRRAEWARRVNAELHRAGSEARVDHRSHRRRAEAGDGPPDIEPGQHLGPARTAKSRERDRAAAGFWRNATAAPGEGRAMREALDDLLPWEREARDRAARNAERTDCWLLRRAALRELARIEQDQEQDRRIAAARAHIAAAAAALAGPVGPAADAVAAPQGDPVGATSARQAPVRKRVRDRGGER